MLRIQALTKRFGPIEVLRGVNLRLREAECYGLVGDNGAGKSTLLKILSGVFPQDSGKIYLSGKESHFRNTLGARRAGIEMIYQDLALCEDLDAASNIFLGRELRRRVGPCLFLDNDGMRREARAILKRLRCDFSPEQQVALLSGGQRQLVAVSRALGFEPRVMLMDEPTAALSAEKARVLLELVERLKEQGVSIMLVSHRFTDVLHVSDRIGVLTQGEIVGEMEVAGQSHEELSAKMLALMAGERAGLIERKEADRDEPA